MQRAPVDDIAVELALPFDRVECRAEPLVDAAVKQTRTQALCNAPLKSHGCLPVSVKNSPNPWCREKKVHFSFFFFFFLPLAVSSPHPFVDKGRRKTAD